ncbi:hypothetical protein EBZ80_12300 [bacterium]|nr:hypothetical protein [bacterium]
MQFDNVPIGLRLADATTGLLHGRHGRDAWDCPNVILNDEGVGCFGARNHIGDADVRHTAAYHLVRAKVTTCLTEILVAHRFTTVDAVDDDDLCRRDACFGQFLQRPIPSNGIHREEIRSHHGRRVFATCTTFSMRSYAHGK